MTDHLKLLVPEFYEKISLLLENCSRRGVRMHPGEGVRDVFVQARYWRRSRSADETQNEIQRLEEQGADFLAYAIKRVGPQDGTFATNAIPGFSWHQWGEAIDCYWLINGRPVWDTTSLINNVNGYQVYAEEARRLGLDCGLYWKSFIDAPHVQLRSSAGPSSHFSLVEINAEMKRRFGPAIL